MKRNLLVILANLIVLSSFAQLNGDGYYRVKNVASGRYITVRDNTGSVNIGAYTADMGAVELYKGFDMIESDPSSILYIDNVGNGNYKFHAQGTDTYEIIGYYLKLKQNSDGSYKAYQGNSFGEFYLGDGEQSSVVDSKLVTNAKGQYRDWYILPVTASSSDNYLGVKSEIKATDGHYASFYASFPFSVASTGMKVYYISQIGNGMAAYKEVTDGIVPAGVPVLVKCTSNVPSENKLNIAANKASAPTDNKLAGVYFCNTSTAHRNVTAYNPETMRVLGTTSDGKLAYVKADYEYLPANKSYLTVPAGSPDVIKVVTEEEFANSTPQEEEKYWVTFKIGDEVVSSQTLSVGDAIVVPDAPAKEGHTFDGWGDVPAIMPASDLTFVGTYTPNNYKVIFKIGATVVSSESLPYGTPIVAPETEEKEGYSFSWGDLLETVPAYNVTFYGRYAINSYTLLYVVDGAEYQRRTLEYGAAITLINEPTKEGHTFSGWSEAPATMPANDVTITGSFTANVHSVFYYVEDELVHTDEVAYGQPIPTYVYEPKAEEQIFMGWIGDAYDTMPDHDVTYTANIFNGIDLLIIDNGQLTIYDLTGRRVLDTKNLKSGIYIVNGKKMIIE